MSVRLLNVKYSPNVGDGLLVLCLEDRLRELKLDVSSIDLAGRTGYCTHDSRRELMMWILETVPSAVRPSLARAGLDAKLTLGLRRHYRDSLAGAGSLVLGGGNLLSDQDLNFPVKIAAALKESVRAKARFAIYGCGVSSNWSRAGRDLMCTALAVNPPVHVTVRDGASKSAWDALFSSAARCEASIVNDPGVLASTLYRFDTNEFRLERPVVAVGLMSDTAIRYHGFKSLPSESLTDWYSTLVGNLVARGYAVCMFTNGSPEDRRFAKKLGKSFADSELRIHVRLANVSLPVDLCRVISSADAVIAFRMHALIAAYSYGKPLVALKWDPKVDAFIHSVGLGGDLVDVVSSTPDAAVRLLSAALDRGCDSARLHHTLIAAHREIQELATSLSPSG